MARVSNYPDLIAIDQSTVLYVIGDDGKSRKTTAGALLDALFGGDLDDVVRLTEDGKYPAFDGSLITGIEGAGEGLTIEETRDGLEELEEGERLSQDAIKPTTGYRHLVFRNDIAVGVGEIFYPQVVESDDDYVKIGRAESDLEMSETIEFVYLEDVAGTPTTKIIGPAAAADVLTGTDTLRPVQSDSLAALWEQGANIASAATIAIGSGGYFHVTGTETITDIDPTTDKAGRKFVLVFTGILTLTHHSTTLILPTGANITTAAGDAAIFVSEGSDAVRCVVYSRADGTALVGASGDLVDDTTPQLGGDLDMNGNEIAGVDATELGHVAGVTSAIQTQLDAKLAASAAVGQQTIWVPASAMIPSTTSGAAAASEETTTNDVMLEFLAFDTAADEYAQFAIQMPKGWNEGTLIFQVVWKHPATDTNFDAAWGLQAVALANDDASDAAFGTGVVVTDTGGTTGDIYISPESTAVTVAGTPGAEEFVAFRVYRDVSADAMAVDAHLLGLKIHYTTDAATDD